MIKNILQLLENTTAMNKNKIAFVEEKNKITYKDFTDESQKLGYYIYSKINKTNKPIVIFIDKSINCLEAMMGTLYSGNFYTIIDTKSPVERFESIIKTLEPELIVTDEKNEEKLKKYDYKDIPVLVLEDSKSITINSNVLDEIRDNQIDTDIMYVLFTSGSTGVPKGTVLTHRAVITYIQWVIETFKIDKDTIWGSQTPFYFSMSITDVFSTIATGATLCIIPKMYFSFPIKLVEFMNNNNVNTIYWVPSALCIVANLKVFETEKFKSLQKVLFAGEVMPVKQLNMWMDALPKAMFANLFGPTETTDICSYYVVNRKFKNDESIPIGKHCDNCNLIIVDENNNEIKPDDTKSSGELLVRGSFLASGYYKNPKKTAEVFVQNPLNNNYNEIVYRTGDIVKYNEIGEIIYLSRKDYQIKHMGYRIELGEIEKNIYGIDEIVLCACVYDEKTERIILFYQGNIEVNDLAKKLKGKLLPYMMPNTYIKLPKMPYNMNGKIDRKKLKTMV